jgi:hypothetical protein
MYLAIRGERRSRPGPQGKVKAWTLKAKAKAYTLKANAKAGILKAKANANTSNSGLKPRPGPNITARVVIPSSERFDHITSTPAKLHRLPVKKKIEFKIAAINLKGIANEQLSYLFEFLQPHHPTRNLRSSNQLFRTKLLIKSALAPRSFSFAAPHIGSMPPDHL